LGQLNRLSTGVCLKKKKKKKRVIIWYYAFVILILGAGKGPEGLDPVVQVSNQEENGSSAVK